MNISYLEHSTDVSRGCCQITSGMGESIVLMVSGLSLSVSAWRRDISCLTWAQSNFLLCASCLWDPTYPLGLFFQGNGLFAARGPTTSICGVIFFATCLTEKVRSSKFSVSFFCWYCGFCFWCWGKSFFLYCGRFQQIFCVRISFILLFNRRARIFVMSYFITVVACLFELFGVFRGIIPHCVHL